MADQAAWQKYVAAMGAIERALAGVSLVKGLRTVGLLGDLTTLYEAERRLEESMRQVTVQAEGMLSALEAVKGPPVP